MKAIRYTRYGPADVLRLQEVERPVPGENEVLVRVHAASVNSLDWHLMRATPFLARLSGNGLLRPTDQRIGVDLAGQVEAVGSQVTQFRVGDDVFGRGSGAFAEYACARENAIVKKPANVTFEAAAAVPVAALTALQGVRDAGKLQPGQQVVIQGASGGVGSFAVQLAKVFGAEVTAVCGPRHLDVVRAIGADHVVDYTREDFTRGDQRYDLIVGVNGYRSIYAYRRALRPRGIYVLIGATNSRLLPAMFQAMALGPMISRKGGRRLGSMGIARCDHADLVWLSEQLAASKIAPVIDACYPLSQAADAMRCLESGHPHGKIVITV